MTTLYNPNTGETLNNVTISNGTYFHPLLPPTGIPVGHLPAPFVEQPSFQWKDVTKDCTTTATNLILYAGTPIANDPNFRVLSAPSPFGQVLKVQTKI